MTPGWRSRGMAGWIFVAGTLAPAPLPGQSPFLVPARSLEVGPGGGTLLLADVNGDGRVDLLSRHLQPRLIGVYLGDGRGGFSAAPGNPIRLDYAPADMRLGDLNGDGALDLAVTHSARDVVDLLAGDGRGRFRRAPGFPMAVTPHVDRLNKRTLQLVDLDEDGDLDIVTANGRRRNSFSTLLAAGSGRFSRGPTVRLDSARDGYSFAFADLDGDRHLDVAAATRASFGERADGRIIVLRGDGRGSFSAIGPAIPTSAGPSQLVLEDIDGDSRPDLILAHANGLVAVWSNRGAGRFVPSRTLRYQLDGPAYSLVVIDLDRDGRPDLAAATVTSVSVLLQSDTGFVPAPGSPYAAGPGAYYVAIEDLTSDGRPEVLSSSFEGDSVRILSAR